MITQRSLNKGSTAISIPVLDQLAYLCFRQIDRSDCLDLRPCFRKMVDERICGKRKYDLRSRQFTKNPSYEFQRDLCESGLVKKKN